MQSQHGTQLVMCVSRIHGSGPGIGVAKKSASAHLLDALIERHEAHDPPLTGQPLADHGRGLEQLVDGLAVVEAAA